MTASSQTQQGASPRVVPLHKATLPGTVFTDASGDDWQPIGHNPSGELLLACPQPKDERDAGEGESFAWTYSLVQRGFGPLVAHSAVSA